MSTPAHSPARSAHLTGADRDRLYNAAEILLKARRERMPIENLPENLRPRSLEEAFTLQDILAVALSPAGGWKIGAPAADATPLFCPMPLWGGYMQPGTHTPTAQGMIVSSHLRRMRGVEAEIAFVLGQDLPARQQPYTREEVVAAIATAHPAIELLESAFFDPDKADRLSMLGDLQMNGGMVLGPAYSGWQSVDLAQESVRVTVDGVVRFEGTASNTAGTDLLRLVTYLANEGAARTGGLHAGQVITTGSWSGKTVAEAGSVAEVSFSHFGTVQIVFAHEGA